ncbi:MAG TPA: hypothetical protein VMG41_02245 [Gemmatimonadales bacterium]|nr:hypothetical protein [Gemmatimonadales bacterium]
MATSIPARAVCPGGIRQETAITPERVLYLRVPDLGAALEKINAAGGSHAATTPDSPGCTSPCFGIRPAT